MLMLVNVVVIADDPPAAVLGGQSRLGDTMYEALGLEAVRNELGNGNERDVVISRKPLQFGPSRR